MSMNKQKGQMYEWVTHTHSHIGGRCPHRCEYCSIQVMQQRFPNLPYSGDLFLKEKEFLVDYGAGKTIFIENCNDLFAAEVPGEWIERVIGHCMAHRNNTYVFQTKNPSRIRDFKQIASLAPLIGCTIETNRENNLGNAPSRKERAAGMKWGPMFLTVEQIMDFDLEPFVRMITEIAPIFVNIGADSKGHGLPEPSIEKVSQLIDRLAEQGIEIREKHNLERLTLESKS